MPEFLYGCVLVLAIVARKIITISEDAYQTLTSLQKEDESLSDAIIRLYRIYQNVTRFSGAFPEIKEVDEELERERESFELRQSTNSAPRS